MGGQAVVWVMKTFLLQCCTDSVRVGIPISTPRYAYSRRLWESVNLLVLGGSIFYEAPDLRYFRMLPRVANEYGRQFFEMLSEQDKNTVDIVVARYHANKAVH